MSKPDLILGERETRAVGRIEVGVGESGGPDIRLNPNSASVRLGGGEGDYSEGDLRLADEEGRVRIHASAGGGAFEGETTRVSIAGDTGTVQLGRNGVQDENDTDIADVTIRPEWASLTLGGGGGGHSDGDVKLRNRDGHTRIHLSGGKGSTFDTTRVEVKGNEGKLTLGGGTTPDADEDVLPPGQVVLCDRDGTPKVNLVGDRPTGNLAAPDVVTGGEVYLNGADARISVGAEESGSIYLNGAESDLLLRLNGGTAGDVSKHPLTRTTGIGMFGGSGSAFFGGQGQEGAVYLMHADQDYDAPDEERTAVGFVLKATENGLELADHEGTTAMRIDTDGTVHVKGGEVESLN